MKDVSKITGLSEQAVRIYEKEFNIQVDRTQGGHRRYTRENINLLLAIKEKIEVNKYSHKQVRQWINGDTIELDKDPQIKSDLHKRLDDFEQRMLDKFDNNELFFEKMSQEFTRLVNSIEVTLTEMQRKDQIIDQQQKLLEQRDEQYRNLLDERNDQTAELNKSVTELIEMNKDSAAAKEDKSGGEDKKKKGLIQRLFGG